MNERVHWKTEPHLRLWSWVSLAGGAERGPHLPAADDADSAARRGQRGVLRDRTRQTDPLPML